MTLQTNSLCFLQPFQGKAQRFFLTSLQAQAGLGLLTPVKKGNVLFV